MLFHVVNDRYLDGPSMRSQHLALDNEIDSMVPHQPDRISGKHRTDFPEPTLAEGVVFYEQFWHSPLPNWHILYTGIFDKPAVQKSIKNAYAKKYQKNQNHELFVDFKSREVNENQNSNDHQ